jgi:exopolyphosphatase / guanosine-5'-triphosphate,3'-diphosphate pyrophosphatase
VARRDAPQIIAGVDLGSNSFHMLVARYAHGQLTTLDRLNEMVRFALALDERGRLVEDNAQAAFACLERFGQRLRDMRADSVRAVGTNTFRRAKNAQTFLARAQQALGHPIEVISGREEARLIYLGVAHSTPMEPGRRLVVDVGGGSTELIVGEGLETQQLVSLYMGCVGMSDEYFGGGRISAKRLKRACLAARMELQPVAATLRKLGWQDAFGTSGTVQTTAALLRELGLAAESITRPALERLAQHLTEHELVSELRYGALSAQRAPVYMGGLAILLSVFEALGIESMRVSDGALREGLLYDMLGRLTDEDARERTVRAMQQRYHVDLEQADRTESLAMSLLEQAAPAWKLELPLVGESLRWAARLHEVGLAIAHAQYHKHGAYLLEHADMAGFSRHEQTLVARLVRIHRRKIAPEIFAGLPSPWPELLPRAIVLLRLAVLLNRSRTPTQVPAFELQASPSKLSLRFPEGWLDQHPLTRADLEREVEYLRAIDVSLDFA